MASRPTIVILACGDFPATEKTLQLLDSADMIVCCDRAAEALLASGREPDLIVGDMDSLDKSLRDRFSDRIRHLTGQDDNDQTKAFHEALKFKPGKIHILGATGRREDHTLGNISLLADYQKEAGESVELDMVSDWGRFVAASGKRNFASVPGQEISIFAFDNCMHMSASGLQYPLDGVVFDSLWKASLNVATGSEFTLSPSRDSVYLVYFCNPEL